MSKLKLPKEHEHYNHSTGKVRGLLCSRCNHALGLFDDDETKLTSATNYLRKGN
jgi:hypothetical protein